VTEIKRRSVAIQEGFCIWIASSQAPRNDSQVLMALSYKFKLKNIF